MRRFLAPVTIAALAALIATAPVAAKGPSEATITGPGLGHGLVVKGDGEGGTGTPLGALTQFGGFFAQMFNPVPDPTTRRQPKGDLGPRYRVVYRVPGPNGGASTVVQDLYPYAKPSPATYMRSGQPIFVDMRTHGGWFVADPALKTALVKAGLPQSPPGSGGGSFPWAWTGAGIVAAILLLLLALRGRVSTRLPALRSTA